MVKPLSFGKVLKVVERLTEGKEAIKEIAWLEGVELSTVYKIRERFPLLCWRPKKD